MTPATIRKEAELICHLCSRTLGLDLDFLAGYVVFRVGKPSMLALGTCAYPERRGGVYVVTLKAGRADWFKTLAHELAHVSAHKNAGHSGHGPAFKERTRGVARHFGWRDWRRV